MNRWTSYHLLGAVLGSVGTGAEQLFAWSVRGAVDGFIDHEQYLRVAHVATQRRLSPGALERRMAQLADLDVNPIAGLMQASRDASSLAQRWNGFNRIAPLGVQTIVADAAGLQLRRHARAAEASSELRAHVTGACVAHLLSPAGHRASRVDAARPLVRNLRELGIGRSSLGDTLDCLHDDPAATLDHCALRTGASRRTLQRELSQAGLRFSGLRQAVRLTLAAVAMRERADNLTGIAQLAGFFDSAHLVHAWKRSSGVSPSQYSRLAEVEARAL